MRLSMNDYVKKIISVLTCAVLSAVFITVLFFCAPTVEDVPETTGEISFSAYDYSEEGDASTAEKTVVIGRDLTAVRISDLGKLGKITKVNYIPDRFERPRSLPDDVQIVDLTKPFEFAEKGTLIFVIMNLDPYAENFFEQVERLDEYKIGDYWNFTLCLPEIFCASNVYQQSKLISRHGDIEDYDFINFSTSYDKKTDKFKALTESTELTLNFYTRRQTMDNSYSSSQIITVHYQSTGSAYSGIADTPFIGTESAVKSITEHSQNLLITFAILAAVVLAVFIVLAALERSCEFVSSIIWVFGIFVMLLSRFLLGEVSAAPLLWTAISLAASFIILGGALLAVAEQSGRAHFKFIFPAFMVFGAILSFIRPFIPFGAASALTTVCLIIKASGAAALAIFIGLNTFRKKQDGNKFILRTVCAALICVAVTASLFLPQVFPAQNNSMFWLCVATTVFTFLSVFMIFTEIKKSNVYLTENLHLEVERQIKDIKAIISERDNLLQFVSHDLKKPLVSSLALLETAIGREKDIEQIKALQIIKQNDSRVVNNLSEIGAYAKFNYIAEPSQVIDLSELCETICSFHTFDCNANGIILKNSADKKYKVFVKKHGLENAVSNIIMNAVEHANCSVITLSVKTLKNKIVLCIADDGKGIDAGMDVFKPYVSEKVDTGGIGLYICKNIIESMNGTLSYESKQGGTAFYITLLKA